MFICDNNIKTIDKILIKPYIDDKEQNRIDFGNYNKLSEETANLLINNIEKEVNEVDLFIINQQVLSGIHTKYFKKNFYKSHLFSRR